jgi:very-short-patch-repair endonuclease
MTQLYNRKDIKTLRKKLRNNCTDAERVLWNYLRKRQFNDLKFVRQFSVGSYVLDFYCPKIKLAIEIDGGQHNDEIGKEYDLSRTKYMEKFGISVKRYWNNDVLANTGNVLEDLEKFVQNLM